MAHHTGTQTLESIHNELQRKFKALKAEFPEISFGYIGNCGVDRSGHFDDRSWQIFLPHPGRIGTYDDRVGGYSTERLPEMLASWPKLANLVRTRMIQRGYGDPCPACEKPRFGQNCHTCQQLDDAAVADFEWRESAQKDGGMC